ncbi:MAG: HEAT repeat domain-containing protein [Candidatus ainarchaeum sp.]|nr:HEAT repeat domain-containing protein [Candidatus ainarchaeum sp.]
MKSSVNRIKSQIDELRKQKERLSRATVKQHLEVISDKKISELISSRNISNRKKGIFELGMYGTKRAIDLIEFHLNDPSPTIRVFSAQILGFISSKRSIDKIKELLHDSNHDVQVRAAEVLYNLVEANEKTKYRRLYLEQSENKRFFDESTILARAQLRKTGSKLVLLGGPQLNKSIVRIVSKKSYLAWKRAFEARDFWKSKGFDYVPIEPILNRPNGKYRIYSTKTKRQYRVFAKVLGPSLERYENKVVNKNLIKYVESQRLKIIQGLRELGIEHKHPHRENFCIEIVGGMPRVYIIDMDRAQIMPEWYNPLA